MTPADLLTDAFSRTLESVTGAVEGLTDEDLAWQPAPGTNSIAWLVWHLTRVQDDHVADVAGTPQVWEAQGFADRMLPAFAPGVGRGDTGYGHTPEQVAAVRASADDLLAYLAAVTDATATFLATVEPADLDAVVDTRWDPPVTLGVRLVSVVDDDAQHAGQAGYLRGLLERR
ncbi:DUF664 domain-containing protein [Nocardioides sp. GY 10127]|uniref:mycothiol transferase n=1 Tax=Nocardioides sp. GY 10127 TaxID=2569762 RepID=UPI0010A7BB17|nr:DUF664 domain-containing protein [Nocardioides sp. GY 10127]TIC82834.1 DUF664 domain-containing protein [Nocardioides sp. GY 10127]